MASTAMSITSTVITTTSITEIMTSTARSTISNIMGVGPTMPAALISTPYVPLWPYNGTIPTGGDSTMVNLNLFYQSADFAWVLTATVLVALQIPGVGFFYAGLTRRKSALSLLWLSLMALAVTSFQFFFWGYSLAFSHSSGTFVGGLDNFGFMNVLAQPSVMGPKVPDLLNAVFMGMICGLTVAIFSGAVAERGRMIPCVIFMFIWATLIWDPIARWVWNTSGWAMQLGALDFAGGTAVHIASGSSALAYSYMLGKRRGHGTQELNYRPHSVALIVLGTVFLWIGWFGFNAGAALNASLRAVMAVFVTNLAASCGGITWCLLDYRLEKKLSTVGFCSGVVAGLVAITPGSGYVPPWAGVIFGVAGAASANFATKFKYLVHCDDALDIFAVHGVAGVTGNLLTGIFAADYIAALDGYSVIPGGWLNHHYIQLAYQLAISISAVTHSFFGTCIILFIMNRIPGLKLRATDDDEVLGLDDVEIGEFAYNYVELKRDIIPAGYGEAVGEGPRTARLSGRFANDEALHSHGQQEYAGEKPQPFVGAMM